MNGVKFQATMGSISAKKDRSVGFRINTPELSDDEKVAIMGLQNELLECTLIPFENQSAPITKIKSEKENKTPSTRLRNTIFALWATKREAGDFIDEDFEAYYRRIVESFIIKIKQELEQYD